MRAREVLRVPLAIHRSERLAVDRAPAASAVSGGREGVLLAEGTAVALKVGGAEGAVAGGTDEAMGMVVPADRLRDLTIASVPALVAFDAERVVKIAITIGAAVPLIELSIRKGSETFRAHKVLRMPFFPERSYHSAFDGAPALGALGQVFIDVAVLTEVMSALFIVGTRAQSIVAIVTREVIRMIVLILRRDHLPAHNRLAALVTIF